MKSKYTPDREQALATLEHELALAIQGATREHYDFAMNEAHALLELSGNEPTCWADDGQFPCSLRLGPHPGWMHFDEKSKTWWKQSQSFPYGAVDS